jgi:hypothetical protein
LPAVGGSVNDDSLARHGAPFQRLSRQADPSVDCSGRRTDESFSTLAGSKHFVRLYDTSETLAFTKDYVYFLFNSSTTFRSGQDQATDAYFLAEQYVMAINALNQPME